MMYIIAIINSIILLELMLQRKNRKEKEWFIEEKIKFIEGLKIPSLKIIEEKKILNITYQKYNFKIYKLDFDQDQLLGKIEKLSENNKFLCVFGSKENSIKIVTLKGSYKIWI